MRGSIAVAIILGASACSTEYGLSRVQPDGPDRASFAIPMSPDGSPADGGAPMGEQPDLEVPELHQHEVVIGGGTRAEVADYLFVVDSSSSMKGILDQVLDGFDALSSDGVFPRDARIAVMNMLPEDPLRRGVVHPSAKSRWWLRFEPGFGGPVDAERIAVFREVAPPHVADRFPIDGCRAWFAPDERNADGLPCLVANAQIALFPVGVEAGLTALGQRLERDPPLFRSGAAVNVVFVSDTHDPGVPDDQARYTNLLSIRPTFAQLETLALSRQALASFRVHAIAPATVCTAEDWTAAGPAYFEAAKAGGGRTLDSCTAGPSEYVDLVRGIATEGAVPQRAVIAVRDTMDIREVLVDGEPTLFSISADGRALSLPGGLPTTQRRVEVRYRDR